jgi:hypothetical protein
MARLVINPIIYAELSVRYSRIEELDAALSKTMFDREAIPSPRGRAIAYGFGGGWKGPSLRSG